MQEDIRPSEGTPLSGPDPKRFEEPVCLPGGRSARREAAQIRAPRGGATTRRYTAIEREELLEALEASGETVKGFAEARGMSPSTLHTWLDRREQTQGKQRRRRTKSYSPDQRRSAVEAYQRSGRSMAEFAQLWGLSPETLRKWLRRYEEDGPQGLENRKRKPRGRPRTIPEAVREEIAETKRRHPRFGMRKVRDWLRRFRGIRVSAGTVQKTLRERDLADGPDRPKPKRKHKPPRRFERARPMQLWQSDITSFLLTRHSQRVYLTVFLDDRSRYVVGWSLCSHQRGPLVADCLLEAIARFGKPEEVLTDQGRQYFAWRGKSAFQKLLDREGIRHVVARTHHPQTLGKCERLWKTVGEELWDRTRPQDLAEARERLGHYFAHYNHFRPHQGIDGLVPADRFFGAEDLLRRSLEERLSEDELDDALAQVPRKSVYLFGQIGERQVSMHGERGRVVVSTDEGELVSLSMDEMGSEDMIVEATHERGVETEKDPAQERALQAPAEAGDRGARPVGAGERGGAEPGARAVHGDPRLLDGPEDEGRDGAGAGGGSAARVADVAAGSLGDAGRPLAAAEAAREAGRPAALSGGRPEGAPSADRGAGEAAPPDGGPGARAEGPAVEAGAEARARGGRACGPQDEQARPEDAPWGAGIL